ncbi:MAG: hypothetical protein U5K99_07310 [Anaerolineales bacterium]|nr:hypothetical protein [Anaerolineales bacterium]
MNPNAPQTHDSADYLNLAVETAWEDLCSTYDVRTEVPSLESLFHNVDLGTPEDAAETVVTNMLLDVISQVDRFSAWYTKPARDFGLVSVWDCDACTHHWVLTVDTYIRWLGPIHHLKTAIEKNSGVLQGMMLVDRLMRKENQDPCTIARCGCEPPRFIKIKTSALDQANILCDSCLQPFMP